MEDLIQEAARRAARYHSLTREVLPTAEAVERLKGFDVPAGGADRRNAGAG
jgi:hypothetical protein